jgi:hypothetical protein
MKKVFSLLLLFYYSFAYAQNYECVHRGQKKFFTNESGYLRGIRFDSVVVSGTDTIYYPYKTKRNFAPSSDSTNGSWVGSKIIQQPDGTFLFNTFFKDTVVIKTQANVGESWVFYNDHTPDRYIATVESVEIRTFLGITDSVKIIKISAYNNVGIDTIDFRSKLKIKISKTYGFITLIDLYMYPYHKPYNPLMSGAYWQDLYLAGTTGSTTYDHNANKTTFNISDFRSPTEIELYDFQINDVFSSKKTNYRTSTGVGRQYVSIDTILGITTISPYLKRYNVRSSSASENIIPFPAPSPVDYSTHNHILEYDTSSIMNIKGVPEELHNWDTSYFYLPQDTTLCYTSPLYIVKQIRLFETCDYHYYYKMGFGEIKSQNFTPPNSSFLEIGCGEVTWYETTYAIKSGIECGYRTWLYPSSINQIQLEKATTIIFPNPASDIINISSSEVIQTLTIYDIMGRVIITTTFNNKNVTLPIAMLSSGIYILKINNTLTRKIEVMK